MKKEIVFIDEDTLTREELQNAEKQELADQRMKRYYEMLEEQHGATKE